MMESYRSCPVCGGAGFCEIYRRAHVLFDHHPLDGESIVGVCIDCGAAFDRRAVDASTLANYYMAYAKYCPSQLRDDPYYHEIAATIERLVPDHRARILDLGAGGGDLLAALHHHGYRNLEGLDPSPDCAAFIAGTLGIPCRTGSISLVETISKTWDLVLSTGVFEHLLEPGQALEGIRKLLAPGGMAFVLAPDLERYVECLSTPFQEFSIEHINHFTIRTLEALFRRRGWGIKATGRITRKVSSTCLYPDLWVCATPGYNSGQELSNFDGKRLLLEYVSASASLLKAIEAHLEAQLYCEEHYAIWGAGQTASLLLGGSLSQNRQLVLALDSNPIYAGRSLRGAPVVNPWQLSSSQKHLLRELPLVIATLRESTAILDAYQRLDLGSRVVLPQPSYQHSESILTHSPE